MQMTQQRLSRYSGPFPIALVAYAKPHLKFINGPLKKKFGLDDSCWSDPCSIALPYKAMIVDENARFLGGDPSRMRRPNIRVQD
jgi:hypothetical protein